MEPGAEEGAERQRGCTSPWNLTSSDVRSVHSALGLVRAWCSFSTLLTQGQRVLVLVVATLRRRHTPNAYSNAHARKGGEHCTDTPALCAPPVYYVQVV